MTNLEDKSSKTVENTNREDVAWQSKLLPFMVGMPTVVAIFFFVVSLIQINGLNNKIHQSNEIDLKSALSLLEQSNEKTLADDTKLDYTRWKTLSTLEASSLQLRYRQASVLLMFNVWTRYLGFVTGMILALVGSSFILGKLREPDSKIDTSSSSWKFSLTTASPGLMLTLLGTILMITTLIKTFEVNVSDGPAYTQLWLSPSLIETSPKDWSSPSQSDKEIIGDVKKDMPIEDTKQ
jgi:hypothetical protein